MQNLDQGTPQLGQVYGKDTASMTFLEAALEILKRERKALHFKELTEKAINNKLLTFVGRTPEVTMQTQLTNMVKKQPGNPFVRVKPGVFGLLRYPELPVPSEPAAVVEATSGEKEDEKSADSADPKRTRRRRGGRGRHRNERRPVDDAATDKKPVGVAGKPELEKSVPEEPATSDDENDDTEEPRVGMMSAEARAAALAESGVLNASIDDEEEGDEEEEEDEEIHAADSSSDMPSESDMNQLANAVPDAGQSTTNGESSGQGGNDSSRPAFALNEQLSEPRTSAPNDRGPESTHQNVRKVMVPVDAAIEVLRSQAPGRGMHVRQIADSAVRRRLIHGEPNEAWRVLRAALSSEAKERLRNGVRPRIKPAGSGLYALARRPPDADLEKAEMVFGEARRALRERTLAALEQRIGELSPAAFEAITRVLLQREGFGPATFVKRVEGTIYIEALRGRGFRPSKCLIALRPGMAAAGRRALGELRAGIRARNQDEGLILLAGRLADDAISEWKQPGPPVEIVDGPAMAESCVRHGLGVISAPLSVEFVDADYFVELAEG
jgi:hypothetical protein